MEITRPRPRPPKDLICRKHPKNAAQSPGVCSVCLMEKLSQLYTATVSDISGLMMKSRSVAFITRRQRGEDDGKGKTAGFWSKLLRRKKNRVNERLMHSKTTRERVAVV
nr:Protein ovarian tumor locus like [Ipomoea batatas]